MDSSGAFLVGVILLERWGYIGRGALDLNFHLLSTVLKAPATLDIKQNKIGTRRLPRGEVCALWTVVRSEFRHHEN